MLKTDTEVTSSHELYLISTTFFRGRGSRDTCRLILFAGIGEGGGAVNFGKPRALPSLALVSIHARFI